MAETIEFNLNGETRSVEVPSEFTVLDLLREGCDVTSPKNGCSPQGQCGCCTVMVDGKATISCVVPAAKAKSTQVMTLEGIGDRERQVFRDAFVATGGLQCGFCIPGIVMRAKSLLAKKPEPTRDEIAGALGPHLCRCTGYVKIVDAIDLAGKVLRGAAELPALDWSGKVGTSLPRFESAQLALGDRDYVDDMKIPGMLRGALVLAKHPRAKVLAIDTSKAKAMKGVHAVLTADDVPGQRYQGLIYRDWPVFVAVGEETRYVGDVIAAVAADDELTARAACEAIEVQYEVLTPIGSYEDALAEGAPKLHKKGNLLSKSAFARGDVDAALAASKHVVTETFRTQMIEHLFLEPESCIAVPAGSVAEKDLPPDASYALKAKTSKDGDAPARLTVFTQGQGVFEDRRQVSSVLGWQESDVNVVLVTNGGAFGGKEDLSIQAQTSLLAVKTGRPVKLTLLRDESLRIHPKRHAIAMTYSVGCDEEGKLTAVKAVMYGDKGAYASVGTKVVERAQGHATSAYRVPNVSVTSYAVYTNNPPCGAMRGFGANQAAFAMEQCMDMLAAKVGIDGWEMRWRNALEVGDRFGTGQVLDKSVGLKKTLLAVKDIYRGAKFAGIACGIKNTGIGNGVPEHGRARLRIEKDGTIGLYQGFTEMGQGLYTVLIQCAADVTGIDPRRFVPRVDTERPVDCGMTTASRATVLGGEAVRRAALELKAAMEKGQTLGDLVGQEFSGTYTVDDTTSLDQVTEFPKTHMSYSYATQVCILDDKGKVQRMVAAHDVGKAINPQLVEGQIEGSVHMGLGYALTEEVQLKGAEIQNPSLRGLGVLRAKDMPQVDVIIVEEHEPSGPFGAKGVGEIGLVPTAPAVANALYKFDGIRRTKLPMKDSPAAKAMSVGKTK